MDSTIVKLFTAFAIGIGASTWLVSMVRALPLDDMVKIVLCIVVPVPSIAIVLVLLCWGPEGAVTESETGMKDLVETFLYGVIMGLAVSLGRWLFRRFFNDESSDHFSRYRPGN